MNLAHLAANCLANGQGAVQGARRRGRRGDERHTSPRRRRKLIKVEYEAAAERHLGARRDEARRAAAARRPAHRRDGQEGRQADATSPTHLHFEKGNVDDGFKQADVVVEREFTHGQRPSGLHRAARRRSRMWNEDGHLTIWTAHARLVQLPASRRPSCCRFPSRKSSSCRARSAAASAARSPSIWSRSPPCSAASAAGR